MSVRHVDISGLAIPVSISGARFTENVAKAGSLITNRYRRIGQFKRQLRSLRMTYLHTASEQQESCVCGNFRASSAHSEKTQGTGWAPNGLAALQQG